MSVLLVLGAVAPIAGKLGDIFGQANVYIAGYCTFVLGSFGGFSRPDYEGYDMLIARIVMGVGVALLFTNSSAIVSTTFQPYNKVDNTVYFIYFMLNYFHSLDSPMAYMR